MYNQNIVIRKITPTIGAEISNIDLRTVTDADIGQIERALLENGVVFFRGQMLTPEQHIAFGRRFGELESHPYQANEEAYPELYILKNDGTGEKAGRVYNTQEDNYEALWHSDLTCNIAPPMGAILMLREIPANGGGDTLWCNTCAAYDALSDPMKKFLSGLTAMHGPAKYFGDKETQTYEHPVVRTHPVTGRRALYVNSIFTKSIVQLEPFESDRILQMLYQHMESPRFHCRFKWEEGSVAFWDNRSTQHRPIGDYAGYSRYGQRVTLRGDRPFLKQAGDE